MAKLFQSKNLGGKKRKNPGNLMLGFGGHINKHRDFTYLPTYLVEPFCLDPYILGYIPIGRRVGIQNGGSEEGLGIPTLCFFSSVVAAVRAPLQALREGNGGGACGR
jgi:hypothetical protein